jgi:hypothetical protein
LFIGSGALRKHLHTEWLRLGFYEVDTVEMDIPKESFFSSSKECALPSEPPPPLSISLCVNEFGHDGGGGVLQWVVVAAMPPAAAAAPDQS